MAASKALVWSAILPSKDLSPLATKPRTAFCRSTRAASAASTVLIWATSESFCRTAARMFCRLMKRASDIAVTTVTTTAKPTSSFVEIFRLFRVIACLVLRPAVIGRFGGNILRYR